MMKIELFVYLIYFVFVAASQDPVLEKETQQEWINFKNTFNKVYESSEEESIRSKHFSKNFKEIKACNAGNNGFSCGTNEHSDWNTTEIQLRNGRLIRTVTKRVVVENIPQTNASLPTKVDYRNDVCMAAIKNQKQCGACWAFAASAPLEFRTCKAKANVLTVLSEQNLVDCAGSKYGNYGCNGGLETNAWDYVKANGGQDSRASYPYQAKKATCRFSASSVAAKVSDYQALNTVDEMMNAIATGGPISAGVFASTSNFLFYKSGIFSYTQCPTARLDHSVTIVGYDTINGVDVWIIRNSWGKTWGINGYMYMKRGSNICGIESDSNAVFPLV